MKNKYQYWFYYIIDNDEYELYAYTDDENISNMFESFRDMDKFTVVKKKIDKAIVNELARNNQRQYLKLVTINFFDTHRRVYGELKTPLTITEEVTVNNVINNINCGLIATNCWFPPYIFNEEIKKSLKVLRYDECYSYIANDLKYKNQNNINEHIKPDELGIFIRYFGKTIKKL